MRRRVRPIAPSRGAHLTQSGKSPRIPAPYACRTSPCAMVEKTPRSRPRGLCAQEQRFCVAEHESSSEERIDQGAGICYVHMAVVPATWDVKLEC